MPFLRGSMHARRPARLRAAMRANCRAPPFTDVASRPAADADAAFGRDELQPVSHAGRDWLALGLTAVDAMDTLLLMGLRTRFAAARDWAAGQLDLNKDVDVNVFETTIRILGGLLSTHHLRAAGGGPGEPRLVAQAAALGERMKGAFGTPTGLPLSDVNLRSRAVKGPDWGPDSSVSEVATLRMEWSALAEAAETPSLAELAIKAQRGVIALAKGTHGLADAKFVNPHSGAWGGERIATLGARVDSFYEYLLKCWIQGGKRDAGLLTAYQDAVHGVTTRLLARTMRDKLLFIGERYSAGQLSNKMDHLVCFYPGLLALGHLHGVAPRPEQAAAQAAALAALGGFRAGATQLDVAEELAATCREMYARNPLHLGPEIAHFVTDASDPGGRGPDASPDDDVIIKPADAHCLLRPEYVESLFVLWRVTGAQRYRDWGWDAWRGLQRHAAAPRGGYASVESVLDGTPRLRDSMESFFLGETLKYLFLLFDDDGAVDLTRWVLNTEAHPLPLLARPEAGA